MVRSAPLDRVSFWQPRVSLFGSVHLAAAWGGALGVGSGVGVATATGGGAGAVVAGGVGPAGCDEPLQAARSMASGRAVGQVCLMSNSPLDPFVIRPKRGF
jgi:hypothetical protein